jgi:hypothetical protein
MYDIFFDLSASFNYANCVQHQHQHFESYEMCTTFEQNLHFYVMFKISNRENDEIKQVNISTAYEELAIVY